MASLDHLNRLLTDELKRYSPEHRWMLSTDTAWEIPSLVYDGDTQKPVFKSERHWVADDIQDDLQPGEKPKGRWIMIAKPVVEPYHLLDGMFEEPVWALARLQSVDQMAWQQLFGSLENYVKTQWIPIFTTMGRLPIHLKSKPTRADTWDIIHDFREHGQEHLDKDMRTRRNEASERAARLEKKRVDDRAMELSDKLAIGVRGGVPLPFGKRGGSVSVFTGKE